MITIHKGKVTVLHENILDYEDYKMTIEALLYTLQAMDEDMLNQKTVYHIAALLEDFMPSIEQWRVIFEHEKKALTQK